ncbi:MAG: hypothetical protein JXB24_07540 [Bacteroidales bacterium]|nr:hypothetical protein [Bacteroidales bacterium]
MIFKVFLIALIILTIALPGLGLKLLFNNPSKQAEGSCRKEDDSGIKFGCGCGAGFCMREE